ncbi:MAG: AAA family ATPase [Enhygromyxa sp.]
MSSAVPIEPGPREVDKRREHPVLGLVVELVHTRARRRLAWEQASEGDRHDLAAEQRFYTVQPELAPLNRRIEEIERALGTEQGEPLQRIVEAFELSAAELDLLLTCLALALAPELRPLYAQLNGSSARAYATEDLAARLFGWGRRALWFGSRPLAVWGLVRALDLGPGQPESLFVDPQIRAFLQGQLTLDPELVGVAELISGPDPLPSWPLERVRDRIARSLDEGQPIRVALIGPRGCGRRSFAATLAGRFGGAGLLVDTDEIDDERWPEQFVRINRLCLLARLVPIWYGARVTRRWPKTVGPTPLQFVACEDASAVVAQPGTVDERVIMPSSSLDERRMLWQRLVPSSAAWAEGDRERIASRHRLAVGDIAEVGRRLPGGADEAALMAREQTRGRLGELGRLLECPFDWNDLVLSDKLREALEDFTFEASERASFWEGPQARRLFPRGTGLVALFTGSPGTGKTMAAQVIAAQLELDLFRINLASVISKYIGETAKNLDRIFSRAARMNAVLLFDEADALFSKRTEVKDSHDRYANTDTNYLLQLLEDYQGIALLASNKKNNIDAAFIRRIRYVLEFQRPEAGQRRTIWRRVLGELLGAEALRPLEPTIAVVADAIDISGAQIKNAVLAAVFLARRARRPVGIAHLLAGIDREIGKEGRSLADREKSRLLRHG